MPDSKLCPQCGRTYGTDDRFCTVDGATLINADNSGALIGTVLAERYLVTERLGEGGMGEVYLAEHVRMKRKVAVKIMRRWMAGDPVAVSRFHREAENASQITHPNVAQVYDFGETSDGTIYLAMEFVPGEPLAAILDREGRLNAVRAVEIVRQTADALVAAHGMGILHRDLKPDNVMVATTRSGTDVVKLVDFGIARVMTRGTQQFTSTGMIVGTPEYMSPEQLSNDNLDERSDIYALGLIAFRTLTGHGAFPAGATGEALIARLTNRARQLAEVCPDVPWPDALQAAFDHVLAADPESRHVDALSFATELEAAIATMPLGEEELAYRAALMQRSQTPTRLSAVDGATPVRAMYASGAMTPPTAQRSIALQTPPSEQHPAVRPATGEQVPVTAGTAAESTAETTPPAPAPSVAASPPADTPHRDAPNRRLHFAAAAAAGVAVLTFALLQMRGSDPPATPEVPSPPAAATPDTLAVVGAAVAEDTAPPATGNRSADDSANVERARGSVVAIASPAGRGSAFVAGNGVLLTSASLVPRDQKVVDVYLEPDRYVRGTVVQVDSATGVAAISASLSGCRRCRPLELAFRDTTVAALAAGDTLVALTAGRSGTQRLPRAVSAVAEKGITTTTPLAAANAGAPLMLPRANAVVAIAARRGSATTLVPAAALRDLVRRAAQGGAALAPNDTLYWGWPVKPFPRAAFAAGTSRDDAEIAPFRVTSNGYTVLVMTPPVVAWRGAKSGFANKDGGVEQNPFAIPSSTPRPLDPLRDWGDWKSIHDDRRAVVVIDASPQRAAFPLVPDRLLDVKDGDFLSMVVRRDGVVLQPIASQRVRAVARTEEYTTRRRPIPNAGVAVFHAADFASPTGQYTVEIVDASQRRISIALPSPLLQAVAGDLRGWVR